MALTEYTIKITNGNSDPTFVGTKQLTLADLAVISPTGITTPQTPYVEWVSDTTTQLDGSVQIPAWKRSGTQYFVLPAASIVTFTTDIADEAIFYQGLTDKFANVKVEITTAPAITTYKVTLTINGVQVDAADVAPVTASSPDGLTGIKLTYASSNEEIATIVTTGSGDEEVQKVHAVKAGTVTITGTGTAVLNGETINVGAKATISVAPKA